MLKRFEVENFKGFEKRLVFDFTAKDYKFNEMLQQNGIVNKAIVYGKNGTGKSSLGIAVFDIVSHLTDRRGIDPIYKQNYKNLNTSADSNVFFKYVFKFENDEVEYEYEKSALESLVSEKVTVNGKTIVDYSFFTGMRYIDKDIEPNLRLDLFDNKMSIVKYMYRNVSLQVPQISRMAEFCNNMLWYRSLSEGNNYSGFTNGTTSLQEGLYASGKIKEFERFLHENGVDYRLKIVEFNGVHRLMAVFNDGREVTFESVASTGTMALYLFFFWKITAFDKIKFLFIDEFDAFLHYEASENLVMLLNKEMGFQTVLTTHNTDLMTNKLTRPDCCFIMTDGRITCLRDATDRELREGHNLEKLYKGGEFNA